MPGAVSALKKQLHYNTSARVCVCDCVLGVQTRVSVVSWQCTELDCTVVMQGFSDIINTAVVS